MDLPAPRSRLGSNIILQDSETHQSVYRFTMPDIAHGKVQCRFNWYQECRQNSLALRAADIFGPR